MKVYKMPPQKVSKIINAFYGVTEKPDITEGDIVVPIMSSFATMSIAIDDIEVPIMPPFEGGPYVCKVTKITRSTKLDMPPSIVFCKLLGKEVEISLRPDSVRLATPYEIAEYKLAQKK